MVFFSAVGACLWLPTRYCNIAVALAFVALGHVALTDKNFAFFWLLVVQQAFFYHDVCLVWCSLVN
jgi:hypothetical protein